MKIFSYRVAKYVIGGASALMPVAALAQSAGAGVDYFTEIFTGIGAIINLLIPVALALGLLVFLWGLIKFITSAGNEDAAASGRRIMIWGILAMFVMVAIWGIIAFLGNLLGIDTDTASQIGPGAPLSR